jgi:hypothetical protein
MSNDMIRELFRGVESTLYERLRIIEDILVKQRHEGKNPHMEGVEKRLHETAEQVNRVETQTMRHIEDMNRKVDMWMTGMSSLEQRIIEMQQEIRNKRKVDERPVELVQAQLDENKNATIIESNAKVALEKAVRALPTVVETKKDLVVVEEEEVEEVEEEEEEVEEEVEEEEEEEVEEEEEALTAFEFKGKTYYHDAEYKVYIPDEDGAVSDPVGIYDPPQAGRPGRIRRLPST